MPLDAMACSEHLGNNRAMNELGQEIYRTRDDQGWICVFDNGQRRFLAFGNDVEQSCMSLGEPYRLEHVYTQAMMLATLFPSQVGRATLLGLGGGSLARALLHYFPVCRVTAVELRAQVATVARRFFELPHELEAEYPVVYAMLRSFYRQNPLGRLMPIIPSYRG